ncbi:DUF3626 domain-containing protein [Dactylosporangium sp. NBC_01737]|uniref:DUF3626 domain-containing protein n=1 Tax=Dactylosporangium sp. NBC_01737 TaxID=2975959 RepID=UPI002E125095|nr:DUF3626 domain-containing protein [Dactylosporangium sp. NBC_01737]
MDARLTPAQLEALAHVRAASGARTDPLDAVVTINFHPDRIDAGGRSVVEGLLADGRFRSQFETGISNGGLTAHPGGDRDRWEERMFGGAYQRPGVVPADRPKYGALDLGRHPAGAARRFGSAHLRLRPEVNARATFTLGDSFHEPAEAGVFDALSPVLAGLTDHLTAAGPLDDYVEAQVHGPVDLARDVEALVLDDSFAGRLPAAELLTARFDIKLEWRAGSRLAPDEVPEEFRGPEMRPLAVLLCERYSRPLLDAELIGRAARDVVTAPGEWAAWGTPAATLQLLKYLWHILAWHGR